SMALWEAKPSYIFSGEKFKVALGDESRDSIVLEPEEIPPAGMDVIEVPIELHQPFVEDTEGSLMNLAGVSVVGMHSFISSKQSIYQAIDDSRVHPFDCVEVQDVSMNLKQGRATTIGNLYSHLDIRKMFNVRNSKYIPKINPGTWRVAHVDIG